MTAAKKATTTPSLSERGQNMDLWPTEDGPWFRYKDNTKQAFDDGIPWCSYAECHPNSPGNNRYPHPDHPASECRTRPGVSLDDVRAELDGEEVYFDVFAARPFTFGEPRDGGDQEQVRVVFAFAPFDNDAPEQRFSLPLGEALILARHLEHLVDVVRYYAPDSIR